MWKFLCKFFYFEWHLVVKNETIRIAFNRSSLIRFGLNGEKKIINSSNIVRSADCGVQIERFIEPKSIVNYLMKTIFFQIQNCCLYYRQINGYKVNTETLHWQNTTKGARQKEKRTKNTTNMNWANSLSKMQLCVWVRTDCEQV